MKKALSALALSAMLVGSLTACGEKKETASEATATPVVEEAATPAAETPAELTDGTFTGTGNGNNGEIKVEVTVAEGKITAIEVKEQAETEAIYATAEQPVIEAIIAAQSTTVDAVSGATNSSNGIMEAVANALASK